MRSNILGQTILLVSLLCWFAAEQPLQAQNIRVTNQNQLVPDGGRLAWSRTNNTIVYDKQGPNGYFDIWSIMPDGSGDTCLTCSATALPPLNKGNPVWSPDGKFIVFQAQEISLGTAVANIINFPGSGWNNDLWAMNASGTSFWRLTSIGTGSGGVICPTFSWDGTKLVWGQRLSTSPAPFGSWELALGAFTVSASGTPSVTNVQYFTPGTNHYYYEPHGFSLDNQTVFFMGNLDPGMQLEAPPAMNVYSFNFSTRNLTNLTNTLVDWNEYPEPLPSGNRLVYMSTIDTTRTGGHCEADLWMMNYDGSGKQRLTFYNDPNSPDYVPAGVCLDDHRWNADASKMAVFSNDFAVFDHKLNGRGFGQILTLAIGPANATANAASYDQFALSPDSIVSTFGTNLADQTLSSPSTALATNLGNTTVNVTDAKHVTRPAPLYFVSPNQINFLLPLGTAPGPAVFTFTNPAGVQSFSTVEVAAVSPAFYTASETGTGVAAAYVQILHPDGTSTYEPVYSCPGGGAPCTTAPIDVSDTSEKFFLTMFGTGFRGRSALQAVTVTIGGQPAPVVYAGPQNQWDGLDQMDVQIPNSLAGSGVVNVVVSVDNRPANAVQIQLR